MFAVTHVPPISIIITHSRQPHSKAETAKSGAENSAVSRTGHMTQSLLVKVESIL